jgi:predicted acylesterase/phospholipase RssA
MSATAAQPLDTEIEEVRLAMALNGGVSLSVWMGGVAVELDCARRAEAADETGADTGTHNLYTAILGAFQRRLVIDILSGASAGGLNGALLAAAIRTGRRLNVDMLRSRWLDIGDFLKLLQPMTRRDPPSLMQGGAKPDDVSGLFYQALREMFSIVLGTQIENVSAADLEGSIAPGPTAPLDVVLDVMMTNVQGEPRRFRDYWGNELAAREYRSPFRFRSDADFTVAALATAARSSASFPFAFEPFRVQPPGSAVAGFDGSRYAVDGGLLENAPIDAAIRLIPTRSATTQVKRFVCYLNAAPPKADPADPDPGPTTLADVAGWVVNVPRNARFVDQLYAVQDAQRRASVSRAAQPKLLCAPWTAVQATAEALLPTYRTRRLALALQEIFDDPARADALALQAGEGAPVPWLPDSVDPPATAAGWRWGVRTAQRILHLQIDLLRIALGCAPDAPTRARVLGARRDIFGCLEVLVGQAQELVVAARAAASVAPGDLASVELTFEGFQPSVFDAVCRATDRFLEIVRDPFVAGGAPGSPLADLVALKGLVLAPPEDEPGAAALTERSRFLRRALAAEVIQRAFATAEDIEAGQELPFAQFTPLAPIRIFTSRPFDDRTAPDSGSQKLTGTKLMHFSAFYRRSWRANDFMWGRLDGATRLADLLIDETRAGEVGGSSWITPAAILASAVLPPGEAADERHALVEEALRNANAPGSGVPAAVSALLRDYPAPAAPTAELVPATVGPDQLRTDLCNALEADLAGGEPRFTRAILSRALQASILRDEYEHVTTASAHDAESGAFVPPLPPANADRIASINAIRSLYYVVPSSDLRPLTLPAALGLADPDEETSDLALRTISRTLYALLAAVRRTVILGRLLAIVRAPLLPISGIVARTRRARASVIVGFAAAASYLIARLLSASPRMPSSVPFAERPPNHPELGALWDPGVLLTWLAVLVLLGAIFVPALRAVRARSDRRRRKALLALLAAALFVFAFVVPIAAAAAGGRFGLEQLLGTPGAAGIPHGGTKTVLGLLLGTPAVLALVPAVVPGRELLQRFVDRHVALSFLYGALALAVLGWSIWKITDHVALNWRVYALASAGAATLLFAVYIANGMLARRRATASSPQA